MDENILRDYFLGVRGAPELSQDLANAIEQVSETLQIVRIRDLESNFLIDRSMLIHLCDEILEGKLHPTCLEPIAFALLTSDRFDWDDDLVADVLNDWSAPAINLALTLPSVNQFREYLLSIRPYPDRPPSNPSDQSGKLIFQRRRMKLE